MTFEADLDATLMGADPAIGTRVFPDFAPVGTQRPYVTYQEIGGGVVNLVDNTIPNVRKPDIQVNVWADTRKEAKRIALAIEAAMHAATAFIATRYGEPVADFDAQIKRYGTRQDFCCKYHT
jgi:hypothetical protein